MHAILTTLRRWVLKVHGNGDVGSLQRAHTKVSQRLQSRMYWKETDAFVSKLRLVRPFEEDAEGLPPRALDQEHQLGLYTPAPKPWYIIHPSVCQHGTLRWWGSFVQSPEPTVRAAELGTAAVGHPSSGFDLRPGSRHPR